MGDVTLVQIMKFFGYDNTAQFRKEWNDLNPADKEDIKAGLNDGTLTYPDHKKA